MKDETNRELIVLWVFIYLILFFIVNGFMVFIFTLIETMRGAG